MNLKNLFRRSISFLLIAVLALSMVACGQSSADETTDITTEPTAEPTTEPTEIETLPLVEVENPITFVSLSLGMDKYLMAYIDESTGSAYVDYRGDVQKRGNIDAAVMANLTVALEESGLVALNGQEVYEEGDDSASVSAEYKDGTTLNANFSGSVPQEFITGYEAMEAVFVAAVASLPVYIPEPQVIDEVDPDILAAMKEILMNSGMEGLDTMLIGNIPVDDSFGFAAGLSSSEGILAGASGQFNNIAIAYSLVIVTTEEGADQAAIAADFETSLDWRQWVCVPPESGLTAQKGNMVLRLVGSDTLYSLTSAAIEAAGWTIINTMTNPDL